ncbi:MAG: hypothetical protein KJ737_06905 [Proteobacteria bacterium]|nr:hypothetical protein [Pseudomonadota bacterium]
MRSLFLALILFLSFASSVYGAQGIFTPAIGVGAEYTDNVYLTNDERESDIILFVAPQLTVDLSRASRITRFFFSPSFRNYVKGVEDNVTHYNASCTVFMPITRTTVFEFSDLYFLTDDPAEDLNDTTIRNSREIYYKNSTSIGLKSQFGSFDSVYMRCVYSALRNDDPAREDSDQVMPSAGIVYRFLPEWILTLNTSYTFGEFLNKSTADNSGDFDSINATMRLSKQLTHFMDAFMQYSQTFMRYKGQSEDYDILNPSIGISVSVDDDPLFSIQIGYYLLDRHDTEDESGLTISGNLGQRFRFRKGDFSLSGSSGYDESYFGAENLGFEIYHQGQAAFNYELTKNIRYQLSGKVRHGDYRNIRNKRIDITKQVKTGFNWSFTEWLDVTFSYEYKNVDVNAAVTKASAVNEDYYENRFLLEAFFIPSAGRTRR